MSIAKNIAPTSAVVARPSGHILIVDDEESLCSFLEITLAKNGYQVSVTQSPRAALATLKRESFDVVIADLMMPEMSGLELLGKVREVSADQDFIVMTAFGSMDSAIAAMKLGAADYITKPFNVDQITLAIERTLKRRTLEKENSTLKKELNLDFAFKDIIGVSDPIRKALALAERVSQADSTVLIRGESGVGKDLVARAIHNASPRSRGPFVTINCAALPESLLESELFGHRKGAFTGAVKDKEGLFQVASGGTFFLDEIGNVSLAIQVKLLRALEDQMITPVGDTKPVKVDVRLIAATNSDLEADVNAGRFRNDLYYRLNVIPLTMPSLRDRREDIPVLVEHFQNRFSQRLKTPPKTLSPEAMQRLCAYDWPGNVRELENSIERAILLCRGEVITPDDFPEKLQVAPARQVVASADPGNPTLESIEKAYIFFVMSQTDGNKAKAAKILGIDNSTLYRKLERYGLEKKDISGDSD